MSIEAAILLALGCLVLGGAVGKRVATPPQSVMCKPVGPDPQAYKVQFEISVADDKDKIPGMEGLVLTKLPVNVTAQLYLDSKKKFKTRCTLTQQ